uniref:Uncharacterized protein n=1 Tax=Zonotrichia albicollis TaxID=44394 RepID=A0A8D2MCD1_ZONAL
MSLIARWSPAGDLFWQDWFQHVELAICSSVPEPQDCAFFPSDTAGQPVSFPLSLALCTTFLFLAGMAVCFMLDSHLHICSHKHAYTHIQIYRYISLHPQMHVPLLSSWKSADSL